MDHAVQALRELVRIPAVASRDPAAWDHASFDALHDALRRHFPLLHERLALTRVGNHALLFHWAGASASRPVVLMAQRVYRFTPFAMTRRQRESIHGDDEHLSVAGLHTAVAWYRDLIERLPA